MLFAVTKCWTRYAVPLRASELQISKVQLSLAQSVEEATAIPAQILFGLAIQRMSRGLQLAAFANGVLWGVALILLAVWAQPGDVGSFYVTHVVYGVGYGANVVSPTPPACRCVLLLLPVPLPWCWRSEKRPVGCIVGWRGSARRSFEPPWPRRLTMGPRTGWLPCTLPRTFSMCGCRPSSGWSQTQPGPCAHWPI